MKQFKGDISFCFNFSFPAWLKLRMKYDTFRSMVYFIMVLVFYLFFSTPSFGQSNQYIIELKDKRNSPFSIANPGQFLSDRAIKRRQKQQIPIVENDLPVNPNYIDSIRLAGNVVVKNTSKWLNQVLIETEDANALQKIQNFTFVKNTQPSRRVERSPERKKTEVIEASQPLARLSGLSGSMNYGVSEGQIKIHKGDFLHEKGFRGQGMLISMIDDGFYHYKTLPAFDSIRLNNRILDTYDFVDNKTDMNLEDAHGMHCLSLIAANVPGKMIGSAPGATFLLYRSENVNGEYRGEEQNWIAAAERSDSAGADVITTSLGYNTFDNPSFDYTYSDMNGRTSMMSKAATIAASKGIIMMVAAGNEGNKPWRYITVPGDAADVLTVGVVNVAGTPGAFSSYGPAADGRIKPEVSSVGVAAYVQATNGNFGTGNGTSFATPNLAGLVTCLWQAFPEFTAAEIRDAVIKSSSNFSNPINPQMGYGIPDFEIAYNNLEALLELRNQSALNDILAGERITVYPNPIRESASVLFKPITSGNWQIKLIDSGGKLVFSKSENLTEEMVKIFSLERKSYPTGVYILQITNGKHKFSKKIIMQ